MHSLLKHKMLQLTVKISLYSYMFTLFTPTCFGPFRPSSEAYDGTLLKLQFVQQCVYWVLCGAQHPVHTQQTEAHIATAQHNFNDVFLLIISTKTVTLAGFRRMLPDDGLNGPKHVEAIQRDILTVSCSILCFNKECNCWQKALNGIINLLSTQLQNFTEI
jgi:hypothetical protein